MSLSAPIPRSQGLIAGVVAAALLTWPAAGADNAAVPDFSPDSRTGWIAGVPDGENPVGQEFLQPPSGPGPITFDKAHPYLDTRAAQRAGKQPTLRVADLTNPILQPWAREELRKVNERALTATVMFTRKERCWPIGVRGGQAGFLSGRGELQRADMTRLLNFESAYVQETGARVRYTPDRYGLVADRERREGPKTDSCGAALRGVRDSSYQSPAAQKSRKCP
jgi:hypothetical protein